jgi:translation initiation factor 2A
MTDRFPALRNKPLTNSKVHKRNHPYNKKSQPGSKKPLSKADIKKSKEI